MFGLEQSRHFRLSALVFGSDDYLARLGQLITWGCGQSHLDYLGV